MNRIDPPAPRLIVSPDVLVRKLSVEGMTQCGLCMFAPIKIAEPVNRQLNAAFGDSGDNLSVKLGTNPLDHKVRFLGGNYMSASFDHTIRAINAISQFPNATMLITHSGVNSSVPVPGFAILEGNRVTLLQDEAYTFFSFAESHLGMQRLSELDTDLDIFFGYDLNINGLILKGSHAQSSRLMLTPWEAIFQLLSDNPADLFRFSKDPRAFEEFIAETYRRDGYKVELTPRSGDGGKDIVATREGFGAVKILDQAKAFSRGNLVTSEDARALLGVLFMDPSASKAVLTTSSDFAPGAQKEFANYAPTRLELRRGIDLIQWVKSVAGKK